MTPEAGLQRIEWYRRGLWPPLLFGLTALFVVFSFLSLGAPAPIPFAGDTPWYETSAKLPLLSLGFWAGSRPSGYPLFLKLTSGVYDRIVLLQIVYHILSHVALAAVLFVVLGEKLRGLLASTCVYLFALSPYVSSWAVVVLSESVSFSTTAAMLAALILVLRELDDAPSAANLAIWGGTLLLTTAYLGALRDNWPYFLALLAVGLLVPVVRARRSLSRRQTIARAVLCACLFVIFAGHIASARVGTRWRIGLTNVILNRVVPVDSVRQEWVEIHGMPIDSTILDLAGEYEHARGWVLLRHPTFHPWLMQRGLTSYARYILRHPLRIIGEIRANQRETLNDYCFEYSNEGGTHTAVARWIQRWIFGPLPGVADFYLLLPPLISLAVGLGGRKPQCWCAWAVFLLSVYLPFQSGLCYLADTNEVRRHCLPVTLHLRLVWMLSLVLLLDAIRGRILLRRDAR